jgi:hypothetical protein
MMSVDLVALRGDSLYKHWSFIHHGASPSLQDRIFRLCHSLAVVSDMYLRNTFERRLWDAFLFNINGLKLPEICSYIHSVSSVFHPDEMDHLIRGSQIIYGQQTFLDAISRT